MRGGRKGDVKESSNVAHREHTPTVETETRSHTQWVVDFERMPKNSVRDTDTVSEGLGREKVVPRIDPALRT